MVDLEKVRIFYYVALEGSLLKASSLLELSSSSISKHISDLENKLNIKLFIRKKRGLMLTEAGHKLMAVAKHAIKDLEEVSQEISNIEIAKPNVLRIVTTNGVYCVWLIEKLKKYHMLNPRLMIKIYTRDDDVDFLDSKADVAILPKVRDAEKLTLRKIKTFLLNLYASPEYLNEMGTPATIQDLAHHRLLSFYHEQTGYRGNVDWHLNLTGKRITPYMTISNGFGLFEATRNGMGMCTFASEFPFMKLSGLVKVLPDEVFLTSDAYFITPANQLDSPMVRELYECLLEE